MIHVIRKLLVDSTVSSLIPLRQANKIGLVKAPQSVRRPYAVIDLENTQLERSIQGIARETYAIMVYITATEMGDAWTYHDGVKQVLDEFSGNATVGSNTTSVARIALRDVTTDAHELHEFYTVQMMFDLYLV